MFTSDPREGLLLAHEHARHLRAEASAERLRGTSGLRRALALVLRRAADRLDPGATYPEAGAPSTPRRQGETVMKSAPAPASEPSSERDSTRDGEAATPTMKAIVQSGYGSPDRLALSELDMPVIGDAQVLVRAYASSQKIGNVGRALNGGRAR